MRIEDDSKLDYKDVLIRPKRSTLGSRKDVDLYRNFSFRNYESSEAEQHYRGIPIMASNMDGVGTFTMADKLAELGLFTCLVKNYTADELIDFFNADQSGRTQNVAYSTGITEQDFAKFKQVYLGYSKSFEICLRRCRQWIFGTFFHVYKTDAGYLPRYCHHRG